MTLNCPGDNEKSLEELIHDAIVEGIENQRKLAAWTHGDEDRRRFRRKVKQAKASMKPKIDPGQVELPW